MSDYNEINKYFASTLENIDEILKNDFYENKKSLILVKEKVKKWHIDFKKKSSLKNISVEDLIFIDQEIMELFDEYISSEPVDANYLERLSYNFAHLKHYWKDEIEGGK